MLYGIVVFDWDGVISRRISDRLMEWHKGMTVNMGIFSYTGTIHTTLSLFADPLTAELAFHCVLDDVILCRPAVCHGNAI